MTHTKPLSWLGTALALQLVVAAALFWSGDSGSRDETGPFLDIDPARIDRLTLSGSDGTVTLARRDKQWTLPEHKSLPADQAQVDALLERLDGLQAGWPVTTSESSHERFKVSADSAQRTLEVFAGEKAVATLYLGTSPGFRQSHVRLKGDDKVYRVELARHQLPLEADRWLDRQLLAVGSVSAIRGPDFALEKHGQQWQWGDDSQAPPDQQAASEAADRFKSLSVSGLASEGTERLEQAATLTVRSGDQSLEYRLFKRDQNHYVRRRDRDALFRLPKSAFEALVALDRTALTAEPSPDQSDTGEAPAEAATGGSPSD